MRRCDLRYGRSETRMNGWRGAAAKVWARMSKRRRRGKRRSRRRRGRKARHTLSTFYYSLFHFYKEMRKKNHNGG